MTGRGRPRTQTGKCSEPGCGNPKKARGWCNKHYLRRRSVRGVYGLKNDLVETKPKPLKHI